ncbi:MAG: DUF4157 domain-containing protein [Kofleriaceae bacterium]
MSDFDPFEYLPDVQAGDAIQRRGGAGGDLAPAEVHAHAAHGISGPAQALPFAAQIAASFGQAHDVSRIEAHVGGAATDAARAIGASAYAAGNHVAFAEPPDLHTAAHEATHVVQQAQGVNLYGGVGVAGDAYEAHADAVADRVVSGQSAADLLGAATQANAHAGTSLQRKEADDFGRSTRPIGEMRPAPPPPPRPAGQYDLLPVANGMAVSELHVGNLQAHLATLNERAEAAGIAKQDLVTLGRDWKATLEGGHASKTLSGPQGHLWVGAAYANAVPHGTGAYFADIVWIIEFLPVEGGAATESTVREGGRIMFSTAQPFTPSRRAGPTATAAGSMPIDPAAMTDHSAGPINCTDHDGDADSFCFYTPAERAKMVTDTRAAIGNAADAFRRACDSEVAAIKAAHAADAAFALALADIMLGLALPAAVKLAAKAVAGATVTTAFGAAGATADISEVYGVLSPGQHAARTDAIATAVSSVFKKLGDIGAKRLKDTIPATSSTPENFIKSLQDGARVAFTQAVESTDNRTDAELMASYQVFRAVDESVYRALIRERAAHFTDQVAPIGSYDAPYSPDFEERAVWVPQLLGGPRLARIRVTQTLPRPNVGPRDSHPAPTSKFLGWVTPDMVPLATARQERMFGEVPTLAVSEISKIEGLTP